MSDWRSDRAALEQVRPGVNRFGERHRDFKTVENGSPCAWHGLNPRPIADANVRPFLVSNFRFAR
jgi:hypothetical protein